MSKLRLPLVLGLGLCAALALAASPIGTWKGKLMVKLPPLPANATPQQKTGMAQLAAMLSKTSITLVVKADKTCTITSSGVPGQPNKTEPGTWSQSGNTVTFKGKKPTDPVQKMVLSPNGKTMVLTLPNGQGKAVFTR